MILAMTYYGPTRTAFAAVLPMGLTAAQIEVQRWIRETLHDKDIFIQWNRVSDQSVQGVGMPADWQAVLYEVGETGEWWTLS